MLIWIRVLKFVFENPVEVNNQMVNMPFFNNFQKSLTCDNYIDGIVKSMAGLSVSPSSSISTIKGRLIDIEESEEEEEIVTQWSKIGSKCWANKS